MVQASLERKFKFTLWNLRSLDFRRLGIHGLAVALADIGLPLNDIGSRDALPERRLVCLEFLFHRISLRKRVASAVHETLRLRCGTLDGSERSGERTAEGVRENIHQRVPKREKQIAEKRCLHPRQTPEVALHRVAFFLQALLAREFELVGEISHRLLQRNIEIGADFFVDEFLDLVEALLGKIGRLHREPHRQPDLKILGRLQEADLVHRERDHFLHHPVTRALIQILADNRRVRIAEKNRLERAVEQLDGNRENRAQDALDKTWQRRLAQCVRECLHRQAAEFHRHKALVRRLPGGERLPEKRLTGRIFRFHRLKKILHVLQLVIHVLLHPIHLFLRVADEVVVVFLVRWRGGRRGIGLREPDGQERIELRRDGRDRHVMACGLDGRLLLLGDVREKFHPDVLRLECDSLRDGDHIAHRSCDGTEPRQAAEQTVRPGLGLFLDDLVEERAVIRPRLVHIHRRLVRDLVFDRRGVELPRGGFHFLQVGIHISRAARPRASSASADSGETPERAHRRAERALVLLPLLEDGLCGLHEAAQQNHLALKCGAELYRTWPCVCIQVRDEFLVLIVVVRKHIRPRRVDPAKMDELDDQRHVADIGEIRRSRVRQSAILLVQIDPADVFRSAGRATAAGRRGTSREHLARGIESFADVVKHGRYKL